MFEMRSVPLAVRRFWRSAIGAAALFILPMAAWCDQPPLQQIEPGTYVRSNNSGTLVITKGADGEVHFKLDSIGVNLHMCSAEGTIKGLAAHFNDDDLPDRSIDCSSTLSVTPNGISVSSFAPWDCHPAICGARADVDGVYAPLPTGCSEVNQKNRREEFLNLYKSRQFSAAIKKDQKLITECSGFIDWIGLDEIRNEIALAQFHNGNRLACVQILNNTLAGYTAEQNGGSVSETDLNLAPGDLDNYIDTAHRIWYNRNLCGIKTVIRE